MRFSITLSFDYEPDTRRRGDARAELGFGYHTHCSFFVEAERVQTNEFPYIVIHRPIYFKQQVHLSQPSGQRVNQSAGQVRQPRPVNQSKKKKSHQSSNKPQKLLRLVRPLGKTQTSCLCTGNSHAKQKRYALLVQLYLYYTSVMT